MADLTTMALAENRAYAKVADHTWINAYATKAAAGDKYAVMVQRYMTTAFTQGGWTEITDNTTD
jgi:hypothetical protein